MSKWQKLINRNKAKRKNKKQKFSTIEKNRKGEKEKFFNKIRLINNILKEILWKRRIVKAT